MKLREILVKKLLSQSDSDGKEWQRVRPFGYKLCGCSSVVERDLAKVDVESSNLFTRSIFLKGLGTNPKPFSFSGSKPNFGAEVRRCSSLDLTVSA